MPAISAPIATTQQSAAKRRSRVAAECWPCVARQSLVTSTSGPGWSLDMFGPPSRYAVRLRERARLGNGSTAGTGPPSSPGLLTLREVALRVATGLGLRWLGRAFHELALRVLARGRKRWRGARQQAERGQCEYELLHAFLPRHWDLEHRPVVTPGATNECCNRPSEHFRNGAQNSSGCAIFLEQRSKTAERAFTTDMADDLAELVLRQPGLLRGGGDGIALGKMCLAKRGDGLLDL